ncbi:hypothetical protein Jiend_45250 [Micromonospora endophytica]|nr:hypothetical protein [Micromonospora endophytica]BCJ61103.1 hypothetical protein Jiend_45250 [Micromonospora endophytica]
MGATEPGSAREEAERLVATVLATARMAGAAGAGSSWGPLGGMVTSVLGHSGATGAPTAGFATGAAECCVCPVCRGIAALRDPSPEFAERLATGAGDLAAGLASFLRAFTPAEPTVATTTEPVDEPVNEPPAGSGTGPDSDHVWREATRTGHDSQPAPERDVWSVATRSPDTPAPAAAAGDGA